MAFVEMTEAEYRELEIEALEERKSAIVAELSNAESEIETAVLKAESERCSAEYERRNAEIALRKASIEELKNGAGNIIATSAVPMKEERMAEDIFESAEYRSAFMELVCRGVAMPDKFVNEIQARDNEITTTTNASAVVPMTLMNEIIKKLDTYGEIWNRVRKLNVKGGVQFPIVELVPVATWVTEGTIPSESKKIASNTYVSFSYHTVMARFAQTLLSNVVSIEQFNALFVDAAAEAVIKAAESAIIKGDGSAKPLGIIQDTRVPSANKITMAPAEMTWAGWHKKVKAAMKKAYRNGYFIMAQSTWDAYIDGMVDNNGQPVARVTYGINGEEIYRFMGKEVITVEEELIESYESASTNEVVAIFCDLKNYAVNTNMAMTTERWRDPDTKKLFTDCLMICDGKLLDPNGVLIIKKGAQA